MPDFPVDGHICIIVWITIHDIEFEISSKMLAMLLYNMNFIFYSVLT